LQHLESWVHFELVLLIFSQFPSSIAYVDSIKDKMEYIKQINYYINTSHFPCNYTELNVNEIPLHYNCSLKLLLVTWTGCQCGPCTHILNTGRIYSISYCPYLS